MDEPRDPYEVLGVDSSAPPSAVARAYRSRMRLHHPDTRERGPSDDSRHDRELAEVMAAYEFLRGASERRAPQPTERVPIPVRVHRRDRSTPSPPEPPAPISPWPPTDPLTALMLRLWWR